MTTLSITHTGLLINIMTEELIALTLDSSSELRVTMPLKENFLPLLEELILMEMPKSLSLSGLISLEAANLLQDKLFKMISTEAELLPQKNMDQELLMEIHL